MVAVLVVIMLELHLPPADQRYTCQNSGYCCRDWTVPVTSEEAERYDADRPVWAARRPLIGQHPVTVETKKPRVRQALNFLPGEGACAFLTSGQLCDLHRHKGAAYKPLMCQQFPFRFTNTPAGVFVSLSFSCPSVRANKGGDLRDSRSQEAIRGYMRRAGLTTVPECNRRVDVMFGSPIEWEAALAIDKAVQNVLDQSDVHLVRRLVAVDRIATQIQLALELEREMGSTDDYSFGERLAERASRPLDQLVEHAASEQYQLPSLRLGERRMWAQVLMSLTDKRETWWKEHSGFARSVGRFAKVKQTVRLLTGGPWHHGDFAKDVRPKQVDAVHPGLPLESQELLSRWLRVKATGKDFFGPQWNGLSYLAGLRFLLLGCAAAVYVARAASAADGRNAISHADVNLGVRSVEDSLFGYAAGDADLKEWEGMLTRRAVTARRFLLRWTLTEDMIGEQQTQQFKPGTLAPDDRAKARGKTKPRGKDGQLESDKDTTTASRESRIIDATTSSIEQRAANPDETQHD